ncbi:MAG: helix-turn-helix domain-containing protein [Proteobacteria bacterium]|nr:helix-turn-helix domain-containing protein [Pseudomonadota bacterium]
MHEQIQFSEIAKVLKKLLRKKGISYKQIAERLKLSESSIKKLFVSEDCSIQRLAMICDLIDIDIVDLMVGVKGNEPVTFKMSNSQQLFLLENEECFELYWKLVKERKSTHGSLAR